MSKVKIRKYWENSICDALTARGQKTDLEEGKRVGADKYIVKPFSPLELIGNVKNIFSKSEES